MKKSSLILFAFSLFLFSCGNTSQNNDIDGLYDELVTGHDEVMPKTMAIGPVTKKLTEALGPATDEQKAEAEEIKNKLSELEEEMNNWMMDFGSAINGEESQKLEQYQKLLPEIQRLKTETTDYIERAKKLTEKLSQQ